MKILWVKSDRLLPVQNGGNIRSYHIALSLAERHELTFLSYYGGPKDENYEGELKQHFPGAVCLCTGTSERSTAGRVLDYLLHLPQSVPYAVSRFASAPVRRQLASWFEKSAFDVAVCDFLDAAINFPEKLTIPSVLFQHNVESEIWRRHATTEAVALKRWAYKIEFKKMLRYEEAIVCSFHHVIAVSEHDRELMSKSVDSSRITVVPTGVDLKNFRPAEMQSREPLVMFVGAMDWEPNIDAIEYFCEQMWPTIKTSVPTARVRIVGRNPGRRVQKLASESVEVTGSVPAVQSHLQEAAVVVVPLRIGGGTRLKIYEAMAMGKAVVSTSIGAEGLDVHNGRDILLADDANAFEQAVITLLRDSDLRHRYERAAVSLARQYDWQEIGNRFAEGLEAVVGARAHAAHSDRRMAAGAVSVADRTI
jgi:polysaccharide biosynthesis protein PslH